LASVIPKTRTIALVGSETLVGREIRDLFETGKFPAQLKLIASAEDEAGLLTEYKGEPALVGRMDAEGLRDTKAVILAGTPESTRSLLALDLETPLIDLTYGAEDHPRARLRAPMIEPPDYAVPEGAVHVIASPAATALALLLDRVHTTYPIARALAHVFEPASERGKAGLDELQQQTVNLLSFKGQPKQVYDAQAAFNMLAHFGDAAPESLENLELRVERHLASLLSAGSLAPVPSLRLIQAPVFHGHTLSLWVEFEEDNPGAGAVEYALAGKYVDVRGGDQEPPNIVGIAGQDEVAVGVVTPDRNNPHAVWIWAAADNLRLMAANALAVARQLL
jgi:aspartate-semialdehyde dehydrogenase